jgi:hypothetical protein
MDEKTLHVAMRTLLVALAVVQTGCFSIAGSVTGGIIADRVNARRLARAEHERPLVTEAPPAPLMTEESRARCEQVRTNLAGQASHLTNANAQHALILRLPNCMDPSWENPGAKPLPPAQPPRAPDMLSVSHGMLLGLGIGLVVDVLVFHTFVRDLLADPWN